MCSFMILHMNLPQENYLDVKIFAPFYLFIDNILLNGLDPSTLLFCYLFTFWVNISDLSFNVSLHWIPLKPWNEKTSSNI